MKVILLSVGTRGDMEPFLAVGNLLQKKEDFNEELYSTIVN